MNNVLEKTALSETARAFTTPIIGGVAAAGVAYGLPAAIDKIREVRVRRSRDEYISEMRKVFPELKDIPKKDLHVAYNSIAMHSPHVLRDPLLGGQTLRSMANYRQADVNALNEINKLRGNNMMDQAILNATNAVSSGVSEGFKGYQAQRIADQDQAYRERMDNHRMRMDNEKARLERERLNYTRGRDRQRDAYQADRDATLDARDRTRDMRALATERSRRKAERKAFKLKQQEMRFRRHSQDVKDHYMALDDSRKGQRDAEAKEKHDAWVKAGRPASVTYSSKRPPLIKLQRNIGKGSKGRKRFRVKKASYNELLDIVSALRDRNL